MCVGYMKLASIEPGTNIRVSLKRLNIDTMLNKGSTLCSNLHQVLR